MRTRQQTRESKGPRGSAASAAHEKAIEARLAEYEKRLNAVSGKGFTRAEIFQLKSRFEALEKSANLRLLELKSLGRAASVEKYSKRLQNITDLWNEWFIENANNGAAGRSDGSAVENNLDDDVDHYTPKGRKLKKAFERARPDLPSDAWQNRKRKQIGLTLPPDLVDEVTAAAKAKKVDRSAFIEHALRMALKQ